MLKRMMLMFLVCFAFVVTVGTTKDVFANSFSEGDRGTVIAQVQEKLLAEGYDIGMADGVFGPNTTAAVKAYQIGAGLTPDGVVGRETYYRLMGRSIPVGGAVSRGGSSFVRNLISVAFKYMGVPYVFGGTSPWGFDCSGFTQYVYRQMGVSLPRTADVQYYNYRKVSSSNLQPGDLVFFQTYEYGPSHCGIYIGGGEMIHAGSSTGVTVASVFGSYWGSRYWGASRVL